MRQRDSQTLHGESAIKELFDKYYRTLCVFAMSFVKNEAAAVDIVQESFVVFWERQQNLYNNFQNKAFLYMIVRNRCLNYLRDNRVQFIELSQVESDIFFHNSVIEEEVCRMLYRVVEELSPQEQRIINLALDGLKNAEIAEQLSIAESTVHSTKKTAYKKLRTALNDYYWIFYPFLEMFS